MYRKYIKRLIDVILSLCGLIVLWPFLLLFAFITKLDTPVPALFKQKKELVKIRHIFISISFVQ